MCIRDRREPSKIVMPILDHLWIILALPPVSYTHLDVYKRQEENYLLNRFARATLGTNNIDHHRTADYTGLAAVLGPTAREAQATMADIYKANAVLLIGNDVTNQNPLVAWQIRTGVRHHQTRLYAINGQPSKIHRQAAHGVETAKGGEAAAVRWLATGCLLYTSRCV